MTRLSISNVRPSYMNIGINKRFICFVMRKYMNVDDSIPAIVPSSVLFVGG